ncbi:MAG TPA: alkaline phosphatase family protein, partial [Solirubrobacteraceae bacterium]
MKRPIAVLGCLAAALGMAACGGSSHTSTTTTTSTVAPGPPQRSHLVGIHKIQHVVVIMQENRSFDSYFGTYPGADGIPGLAGNPGPVPCVPDPRRGAACDKPFHDPSPVNGGGQHGQAGAALDIDDGLMNGFV